MDEEETTLKINRLLAVFAGTVLWMTILGNLMPGFNTGYALLLAAWIGFGSKHYSKTLTDFERPMKAHVLLALALLAPGWPFLYWKMKKHS